MIKWILKLVILIWFIVSIIFSVQASTNPDFTVEGGGIEHRKGFLVIEVDDVVLDRDGQGHDQFGYPITADKDCIVVMIYNPFTNYCDDIIARWDF